MAQGVRVNRALARGEVKPPLCASDGPVQTPKPDETDFASLIDANSDPLYYFSPIDRYVQIASAGLSREPEAMARVQDGNGDLPDSFGQQLGAEGDADKIMNCAGIGVMLLDLSLRIRFLNRAAEEAFGLTAKELGCPLADRLLQSRYWNFVDDIGAVVAGHAPLPREIRGEDGRYYSCRIVPYRSAGNELHGAIVTVTDISEVNTVECALQSPRVYSDSIVDTIPQPLVVLDKKLRVISCSNSFYEYFGLGAEEVAGRQFFAFAGRYFNVSGLNIFLSRIGSGESSLKDFEIEVDLPLVGKRYLILSARDIHTARSEDRKILIMLDDVTERKHAAEALEATKREAERANVAKSRFLAAASHDLRQPLQTLSLLQGVLATKVSDDSTKRLLATFEETVAGMSGMLNAILDINQLEAGIVHPVLVDFPIGELLEKLRVEFAYHAQTRNIGWRVVPCHVTVRSDPSLLEQMLRNLISNAIKCTRRGRILLGCRRRGGKVRVEVWDTGVGIPTEQFDTIFEEFHQLDNSARDRTRGFGLGLAIVKRLGDLMQYPVGVMSKVDSGSVFSVEVPLGGPNAVTMRPCVEGGANDVSPRGTILLIEDDPAVREMLELLLTHEGHRTVVAADGTEALMALTRGAVHPDLIIADYNLPGGMTGLQVITRADDALHLKVPAIILTGDISTSTLREIALYGYIQLNKPVRATELTHLIRSFLVNASAAARNCKVPSPAEEGTCARPVVFVIDDDKSIRGAVRAFLQENDFDVEDYATCEEFLTEYRPGRIGCIVADMRLPGQDGIALLEHIQAAGYIIPVIIITGYGDVPTAVRAMKAGAIGFIEKPVSNGELLMSVERAIDFARDSSRLASARQAAASRIASLTSREREIMDMVIAGNPNKEIAALLRISQRTVENHRAAVMKKLGAGSLSELIHLTIAVKSNAQWQFWRSSAMRAPIGRTVEGKWLLRE